MSVEWIKMRVVLQTHPKVVRILSATKADKFRVIGGLHAVWSVFDAHSVDGRLVGYTPQALDHVIGWEGFSEAMIAVKWMVFDGEETLMLPEFDEHNGKSGKRRAEDQKRKRESRKSPQTVTQECGQDADEKRTRKEKKRDSNSADAQAFDIHAELGNRGVDVLVADSWIKHRKAKRAIVTEGVLKEHIAEADKAALPLAKALAYTINAGWQAFRADWYFNRENKSPTSAPASDITAGWK